MRLTTETSPYREFDRLTCGKGPTCGESEGRSCIWSFSATETLPDIVEKSNKKL